MFRRAARAPRISQHSILRAQTGKPLAYAPSEHVDSKKSHAASKHLHVLETPKDTLLQSSVSAPVMANGAPRFDEPMTDLFKSRACRRLSYSSDDVDQQVQAVADCDDERKKENASNKRDKKKRKAAK